MYKKIILLCAFTTNILYASTPQQGYLQKSEIVDVTAIIGPPPAFDSLKFANDKAISEPVYSIDKDSEAIKRAIESSPDSVEDLMEAFSGVFGQELSPERTPAIYKVLSKAIIDANNSKNLAKNYYKRQRPYIFFGKSPCVEQDYNVRGNSAYSYPSGHTNRAWTIALILSTLKNDKTAELFDKAKSIAEDRVMCGVHWQSDVDASVIVAMANFTALQPLQEYKSDIEIAKKEVA